MENTGISVRYFVVKHMHIICTAAHQVTSSADGNAAEPSVLDNLVGVDWLEDNADDLCLSEGVRYDSGVINVQLSELVKRL